MTCGAINAAHTAEAELDEMRHTSDWIRYAVNIPMRSEPGSQFAYCSVNNHLLSAVIAARTGESLEAFARPPCSCRRYVDESAPPMLGVPRAAAIVPEVRKEFTAPSKAC